MANPLEKLLRAGEGRILRRLQQVVKAVNALEEDYAQLTDDELRGETAELRARYAAGESLDKMAAYDERLAVENMAFLPDRYDARSYSDKLFQKMSQVILDLGESESCIIEGRLSDYLLRNNPNHIAVLVTAPFEDRVEIVRKKRGLNKKKGAKLVKQQQKAREAFYKRYSAGKWKMTSGKDIVVNRAKLGREGCKDVIAAAYRYKVAQLED